MKNQNWSWFKRLTENKGFEIELLMHKEWSWFEFVFNWTRCCDHAGPGLRVEILGICFAVKIYDFRHWNYDKGEYYAKEENFN